MNTPIHEILEEHFQSIRYLFSDPESKMSM